MQLDGDLQFAPEVDEAKVLRELVAWLRERKAEVGVGLYVYAEPLNADAPMFAGTFSTLAEITENLDREGL